jgi:hypothetical protein
MSFLRHPEIYPSDAGASNASARAHRTDEFPAGYSLASCSPAALAYASPAAFRLRWLCDFANRFAAIGRVSLVSVYQWKGSLQFMIA